jgi:hypothetical protein
VFSDIGFEAKYKLFWISANPKKKSDQNKSRSAHPAKWNEIEKIDHALLARDPGTAKPVDIDDQIKRLQKRGEKTGKTKRYSVNSSAAIMPIGENAQLNGQWKQSNSLKPAKAAGLNLHELAKIEAHQSSR